MNLIGLLLFLVSQSLFDGNSPSYNCVPSVSLMTQLHFNEIKMNKMDTVEVHISCLTGCKPVLKSSGLEITELTGNKFLVKARKPGEGKLFIYSQCPEGTLLEMNGTKMDMSGTRLYDERSITVVN